MGRKKLTDGRDPNLPFICYVCGDTARGNNFSVLSCVSCKSFFRRHGQLKLVSLFYYCQIQKSEISSRNNFDVDIMVIVLLEKKQEVIVYLVD